LQTPSHWQQLHLSLPPAAGVVVGALDRHPGRVVRRVLCRGCRRHLDLSKIEELHWGYQGQLNREKKEMDKMQI